MIETDTPSQYLPAVIKLESAAHANGLDDVTFSVYRINTGEWAGLLMVSVAAPTSQRLGAVKDGLSEPWAADRLARFEGMRRYVRGNLVNCQLYATQP